MWFKVSEMLTKNKQTKKMCWDRRPITNSLSNKWMNEWTKVNEMFRWETMNEWIEK